MTDAVNHPAHYNASPSGVECIDVVEHMGFNLGNVIKYVWRADEKGDAVEDLRKAAWYLEREIARRSRTASTVDIDDCTSGNAGIVDLQADGPLPYPGDDARAEAAGYHNGSWYVAGRDIPHRWPDGTTPEPPMPNEVCPDPIVHGRQPLRDEFGRHPIVQDTRRCHYCAGWISPGDRHA